LDKIGAQKSKQIQPIPVLFCYISLLGNIITVVCNV